MVPNCYTIGWNRFLVIVLKKSVIPRYISLIFLQSYFHTIIKLWNAYPEIQVLKYKNVQKIFHSIVDWPISSLMRQISTKNVDCYWVGQVKLHKLSLYYLTVIFNSNFSVIFAWFQFNSLPQSHAFYKYISI